MTDKMLMRRDGAIGHMIFNQPEKRNAVSLSMWERAREILDDFEQDPEIRVVVLSGAGGKSFVSGADISEFESQRGTAEAQQHYNTQTAQVYDRIEAFPIPTIAMINGFCIGGGLNLACNCDIRICSDDLQIAMPAAKLALGYPFPAIKRLANVVGIANARHLMFTAQRMNADWALNAGFAQQIVPKADLEQTVTDYANTIAANAPMTVAAMKFISTQVLADPGDRDLDRCTQMVADCFASEDFKEGRRAFMEKRKPQFQGK
ncbi:MAG: enoyl-CoA hydratase [Pseudomonadota bacterium]